MGRILGFIFCIISGLFLLGLSFINDYLYCSKADNYCYFQSKIRGINYVLSEDKFIADELKSAHCEKEFQPSRTGKRAYFVLKISKNDNREYILGSYKKYNLCREDLKPVNLFIKNKSTAFEYSSGSGFTNSFGIILAILMFFAGIIILTTKSDPENDEFDDDDENSTKEN